MRAPHERRRHGTRRDPKTKDIQHRHAWKRLLRRFGIALYLEEIEAIGEGIRRGQCRLLQRQSHRVSVWEVVVAGRRLAAVYDQLRHAVVTFLPLEWIQGTPPVDQPA